MNVATLSTAIVDFLNDAANGIAPPPGARRSFMPQLSLEQLAERHVTVVPVERSSVRAARNAWIRSLTCHVMVQRAPSGDDSQQDAMVEEDIAYAESLDDALRVAGRIGDASWKSSDINNPFLLQHLREQGVCSALLTVTYEVDVLD